MAGTLFGLPLSQQLDEDGDPYSGALLYIYEAQTSTPADSYADSGLTTLNAFPMEADASGRIPQFWVDDGTYRARLTTAGGVEIFDEDSILAIGPSVASTGGSSSGSTTTGFSTGDMKWKPVSGTETGWVRANARTIGSASSGGTERASSDTQTLYEFLWNNFSNTLCPVTTGRGATALADFAANKSIATLDMRGYGTFGLDDMGSTAAGRIAAGTPTTAASSGGGETATVLQANLPSYNLSTASLTGSVSTNISNGTQVNRNSSVNKRTDLAATGSQDAVEDANFSEATLSLTSGTVTFGGTIPSGGSGTAVNKMPPYRLGTWYIKL